MTSITQPSTFLRYPSIRFHQPYTRYTKLLLQTYFIFKREKPSTQFLPKAPNHAPQPSKLPTPPPPRTRLQAPPSQMALWPNHRRHPPRILGPRNPSPTQLSAPVHTFCVSYPNGSLQKNYIPHAYSPPRKKGKIVEKIELTHSPPPPGAPPQKPTTSPPPTSTPP